MTRPRPALPDPQHSWCRSISWYPEPSFNREQLVWFYRRVSDWKINEMNSSWLEAVHISPLQPSAQAYDPDSEAAFCFDQRWRAGSCQPPHLHLQLVSIKHKPRRRGTTQEKFSSPKLLLSAREWRSPGKWGHSDRMPWCICSSWNEFM